MAAWPAAERNAPPGKTGTRRTGRGELIMDSAGGVDFVTIPIWIAVPVLLLVLLGAWKLVKLLLLALRG
jgi:hypothetical protein